MTATAIYRLDLDDSTVVEIVRDTDRVSIELEQTRNKLSKFITIQASGGLREKAQYYIGQNVTADHPDPSKPLDYIEYAERGANYIELGGFLENEPWFVWRIEGSYIEIYENENKAT